MPKCYVNAHGGVLTAFWGSWGPKRCGLACGELGQEPLASFWRGFWVYDPGRFLVIMTLASFGPWSPWRGFGDLCWGLGGLEAKILKKTTPPYEFALRV